MENIIDFCPSLTREQIYDLHKGDEIDGRVEESLGYRDDAHTITEVRCVRSFSSSVDLCFEYLIPAVPWFRISKDRGTDCYWCEIRMYPDETKRDLYFKSIARSEFPAVAICKSYLIFIHKQGSSFSGYVARERDYENRR